MVQNFDMEEVENVVFNGKSVDFLRLDNVFIWSKFDENIVYFVEKGEFRKSPDLSLPPSHFIGLRIGINPTSAEYPDSVGKVSVSYGNTTLEQQYKVGNDGYAEFIFEGDNVPNSGLITIKGDFYSITPWSGTKYYEDGTSSYNVRLDCIRDVITFNTPKITNTNNMFQGQSLSSVTLPTTITELGNNMFSGTKLKQLKIPNSVIKISQRALAYVSELEYLNIPDSVVEMDTEVLYKLNKITEVKLGNGLKSVGTYCIAYNDNLATINIPKSIETMGDYAFAYNANLSTVSLGHGLSLMGSNMFTGCTSLVELNIPSSVVSFGLSSVSQPDVVRFLHSADAILTLPTAGSSTGMFYSKSAKEMTIYTDNETIKNYDYATDNITAIIYHLDGSLWD